MCIRDRFSYEQDDGWLQPPLASKMRGIRLKQGQAVRLETPGGGGYGEKHSRSTDKVAEDVRQGLLTDTAADEHYGSHWRKHS